MIKNKILSLLVQSSHIILYPLQIPLRLVVITVAVTVVGEPHHLLPPPPGPGVGAAGGAGVFFISY